MKKYNYKVILETLKKGYKKTFFPTLNTSPKDKFKKNLIIYLPLLMLLN